MAGISPVLVIGIFVDMDVYLFVKVRDNLKKSKQHSVIPWESSFYSLAVS